MQIHICQEYKICFAQLFNIRKLSKSYVIIVNADVMFILHILSLQLDNKLNSSKI
jgi:hypothetical protein